MASIVTFLFVIFAIVAISAAIPDGYGGKTVSSDIHDVNILQRPTEHNNQVSGDGKRPRGGDSSVVSTVLHTVDKTVSKLVGGVSHTLDKVGVNSYGGHGHH